MHRKSILRANRGVEKEKKIIKKFIKGTFKLDQDVTNLEEYEEKHKQAIYGLLDWAERFNVGIRLGVSDDNTYLIEYKIVGNTQKYCKGLLSELKFRLKGEWKSTEFVWQGSGECLW